MKRFRSLIALALSLSLVVLSPGSRAYHAAAQTIGTAASGVSATGASGAVGATLGQNAGVNAIPALSATSLTLTPSLSAPSVAPSALPVAAAAAAAAAPSAAAASALSAAAPAAAKAVAARASAVASAPAAASSPASVLKTLAPSASAPAAESKSGERQAAEARKTFDGEALKPEAAEAAAAVAAGAPVSSRVNLRASAKKDKGMPDSGEFVDGTGRPTEGGGDIDELGNTRRTGGEGGPDDASDPDRNGRGGSGLFGLFGVGLLGGTAAAVAGLSFGSVAMFPMIILSLVLHEIGHARMADKLGDPTARLQNRASFNPLHWKTHIDPVWTLLIPAATFLFAGFIFGGARPVPVEPRYFKNPVKDMALVALAGPAVNMGLAAAGALAVTGAIAAGLGAGVVAALGMFVFLNVLLAIFNLIPLPPLDGSHMLKAFLPRQAGLAMDRFMERLGPMGVLLPMMLIFFVAGGAIVGASMFVAKLLIGGAMSVTGVKLASSFLPAVAALGLAAGQIGAGKSAPAASAAAAPAGPAAVAPAANGGNGPVDLIVMFGEKKTSLRDAHISDVDVNLPSGVERYTRLQQAMLAQLESAGLDSASLAPYKATPLATYARINAATIRVDGPAAAEFAKEMAERGFAVYPNSERTIIRPVPVTPEQMDPSARNAVTMDENLAIVKADSVQALAEKRWGKPELGFWAGLWAKLFKTAPPQPKFGVIDSGADVSHPLLRRVKAVKNMTSGENVDDIGHGSWVTSTVLHLAPWSRNTTHYKTFLNGGATLDDILKSLTAAGNDGNLVISNSWGSDDGDPNSPDSQLVRKLAQEGHIMVFAAGNAGSRPNTIGSPAIVTYKDAATGAIRVVSVAAAGRDKRVAYFSSRGPGSRKTAKTPGYPHRPDLTAVGYNIEGAWPEALNEADRVDGEKGPVKAISGTSMSTPGVAGAIMLLAMMFGVTEKGEKLDAIVNAVMSTLEKTGLNSYDEEGEGFMNVDAAYRKLEAAFGAGPADVKAYRALVKRRSDLDAFRRAVGAGGYDAKTTDELLSSAESEAASVAARLQAMEAADHTLAYRAAGPVKRLILNATGAAPKP